MQFLISNLRMSAKDLAFTNQNTSFQKCKVKHFMFFEYFISLLAETDEFHLNLQIILVLVEYFLVKLPYVEKNSANE